MLDGAMDAPQQRKTVENSSKHAEIAASQKSLARLPVAELRQTLKRSRRVSDVRDTDKWTAISFILEDKYGRKAMSAFYAEAAQ